MAKTLEEQIAKRPGDRAAIDVYKSRMLEEVRAHRLKELRQISMLTQMELATKLHIGQRRVSAIENGDIDRAQVDTLRRYAEAVGGTLRIEVEVDGDRFQIA